MEKWEPLKIRRNGEHFYRQVFERTVYFFTIKTKEEFAFYDIEHKRLYFKTGFPKHRKNQLKKEILKCGRYDIQDFSEYTDLV